MSVPISDNCLPRETFISYSSEGKILLSENLINLLVNAREMYDWPFGTGAAKSQQTIIDLEVKIKNLIENLTQINAKTIVSLVSKWGGNNANSQNLIDNANVNVQDALVRCIKGLSNSSDSYNSVDRLSNQPGLRLVMASKIYRFCCPNEGASLDRHLSYFFNSLPLFRAPNGVGYSTNFKREWSTSSHTTSRLAIYQPNNHSYNLREYFKAYLPLLAQIADYLNKNQVTYLCAATKKYNFWRPTDIEMAAYFWWARNGSR